MIIDMNGVVEFNKKRRFVVGRKIDNGEFVWFAGRVSKIAAKIFCDKIVNFVFVIFEIASKGAAMVGTVFGDSGDNFGHVVFSDSVTTGSLEGGESNKYGKKN